MSKTKFETVASNLRDFISLLEGKIYNSIENASSIYFNELYYRVLYDYFLDDTFFFFDVKSQIEV